jgi:hypothetical protein
MNVDVDSVDGPGSWCGVGGGYTLHDREGLARSFLSNIPLFLLVFVLSCVGYLELDFLGHDVFILHISVVVVFFFFTNNN